MNSPSSLLSHLQGIGKVVCVALLASGAIGDAHAAPGLTGYALRLFANEYRQFSANPKDGKLSEVGMYIGFVVGVQATLGSTSNLLCMPENVQMDQSAAVVLKFIDDHPEMWSESGATIVAAALVKAFPCSANK